MLLALLTFNSTYMAHITTHNKCLIMLKKIVKKRVYLTVCILCDPIHGNAQIQQRPPKRPLKLLSFNITNFMRNLPRPRWPLWLLWPQAKSKAA
ncbi:hypothetical protein CTM75_02855 [Photobacterium phosphoreum]|nr:hypothetical protein CTM75_02855 [Photobacterium phosphoreum]